MRRIWKQPFKANSIKDGAFCVFVTAPSGAVPISVGVQDGETVVWFECDDVGTTMGGFCLYVIGTGHGEVPVSKRFLGTVQHGQYVWHVYHLTAPPGHERG